MPRATAHSRVGHAWPALIRHASGWHDEGQREAHTAREWRGCAGAAKTHTNNPSRHRLRLVSLHMGSMFAAKKSKKARIQSGLPLAGIIKANWLEKHYTSAPAALLLLFNYKAGVPHDTQRMEALANIELMRQAHARTCTMCVCLFV